MLIKMLTKMLITLSPVSGQPVLNLEECLKEWQSKYRALIGHDTPTGSAQAQAQQAQQAQQQAQVEGDPDRQAFASHAGVTGGATAGGQGDGAERRLAAGLAAAAGSGKRPSSAAPNFPKAMGVPSGMACSIDSALASFEKAVVFPPLLGGEEQVAVLDKTTMVAEVGGLRYNLGPPNAMPALPGKLRLTTYRLTLKVTTI